MGWFSKPPAKVSPQQPAPESSSSSSQQYLEDLPPKFNDDQPPAPDPQTPYAQAMQQIKLSDFTLTRFLEMPCFREAMMAGFQAGAVLGGITLLIHKNPNKSMNWAAGGFFLGNIIGWEQCRSLRRKSFETMENARRKKEERLKEKQSEK